MTIELVDKKTQWRSGQINVQEDGNFDITLKAEEGKNSYSIELMGSQGDLCKTEPNELNYTRAKSIGVEHCVIHSIGLALANNRSLSLIKKGTSIPVTGKKRDKFIQPSP